MTEVRAYAADLLIVLGLSVITIGVIGFARMPDIYNKLHAASKAVFLGAIALLLAAAVTQGLATGARAGLIAFFLVLTTPVAAHAVARAAFLHEEPAPRSTAGHEEPAGPGGGDV